MRTNELRKHQAGTKRHDLMRGDQCSRNQRMSCLLSKRRNQLVTRPSERRTGKETDNRCSPQRLTDGGCDSTACIVDGTSPIAFRRGVWAVGESGEEIGRLVSLEIGSPQHIAP